MSGQESSLYPWRHRLAAAALLVGGPALASGCGQSQEGDTYESSLHLNRSIWQVSSDECAETVEKSLIEDNDVVDALKSDVCTDTSFQEGFKVYESFEEHSENENNLPGGLIIFVGGVALGGISVAKMRKS